MRTLIGLILMGITLTGCGGASDSNGTSNASVCASTPLLGTWVNNSVSSDKITFKADCTASDTSACSGAYFYSFPTPGNYDSITVTGKGSMTDCSNPNSTYTCSIVHSGAFVMTVTCSGHSTVFVKE